jgi:hypothetical protein
MELDKSMLIDLIRDIVREELQRVFRANPNQIDPSAIVASSPDALSSGGSPFTVKADRG